MDHSAAALCILGMFITGSWAQHSVTQDSSVMATPGQTVRLSCTLGGGLTVRGNCFHFLQQKLGAAPRHLLYYCDDSRKGKAPGVPDRFVGSGSGSVGYLTITGVLPEDDAVYYCASWTGSECTVMEGDWEVRLKPPQLPAESAGAHPCLVCHRH